MTRRRFDLSDQFDQVEELEDEIERQSPVGLMSDHTLRLYIFRALLILLRAVLGIRLDLLRLATGKEPGRPVLHCRPEAGNGTRGDEDLVETRARVLRLLKERRPRWDSQRQTAFFAALFGTDNADPAQWDRAEIHQALTSVLELEPAGL